MRSIVKAHDWGLQKTSLWAAMPLLLALLVLPSAAFAAKNAQNPSSFESPMERFHTPQFVNRQSRRRSRGTLFSSQQTYRQASLVGRFWWRKRHKCRWHNRARRRRCLALAKRKRRQYYRSQRRKHIEKHKRIRRQRLIRRQKRLERLRRRICRAQPCIPAAYVPPPDYTKDIASTIAAFNKEGQPRGDIKLFAGKMQWGPKVKIQSCFGDNILTKFTIADQSQMSAGEGRSRLRLWFQYQDVSRGSSRRTPHRWVMVEPGTLISGRDILLRAQAATASGVLQLKVVGNCISG